MSEPNRDEEFEDTDSLEDIDDLDTDKDDFHNIIVAPADWTVGSLFDQIGKQIDVDPDFQRRGVWSKKAKSSFIESLFLNIPIPQILLASNPKKRNTFIVLDGKQRLLTIREFMSGKHDDGRAFSLRGLRILDELEGKTWAKIQELPDWPEILTNHTQRTAVLRGWKKESTLYEIFHRLNSGSVKLSPMELRMSLYPGPFLKYAIEKTETHSAIHKLLKLSRPDRRMADVEILVRHLAFQDDSLVYRGNLKLFLDDICENYNRKFEDAAFRQEVELKYNALIASVSAAQTIFGQDVCRKRKGGEFENRFNRAVFDIVIGSLANPEMRALALDQPAEFKNAFIELSDNDVRFVEALETTTKSITSTDVRFGRWYDLLQQRFNVTLVKPNIAHV